MPCSPIRGGVVCFAAENEKYIEALGKRWPYEPHRYFGPIWLRRDNGEPRKSDVPKAVWDAYERKGER